ncbi:putative transcription activator protein acu-15 [Fusarium flagelliforme]|uniref:Putative transcription activator protein acu-15 n=1 Tax=Fusarium flagelliforme TaxID=2675880 RepID=A0A395MJF3_9HYPO|nr:putative transcription activator protein acu-15 [Fusarium flagelliforme]
MSRKVRVSDLSSGFRSRLSTPHVPAEQVFVILGQFDCIFITFMMTSTINEAPASLSSGRVPGQVCFYEAEGIEQRRDTPSNAAQHAPDTGFLLHDAAATISPTSNTTSRPLSFPLTAQGTAVPILPSSSTHQLSATPAASQSISINRVQEPVIGHMGRLVADDRQASMFGGSTTGVHFISQAEQQLQLLQMHKDALPSCAYGLYLHSPWGSSIQSFGSPLVDIIAQLPPSTIQIVEATIDRWTPLYPIVHKSSTIDAIQKLLSSYQVTSSDVAILYQTIGLVALGTIGQKGDCLQQHDHFLCVSEPFYMISASLLDRVIGQPSLQSLQGLVITQIYLQLSGRYSTASHISGVATRLAQTLGLHRHSGRFKFDPLETELRRRAWWCQYSLDAFSSAYHGMPRLIRDQDVDTDLPTSVDHDLLSRTHVEFPLPGERSQVDTAISLFKLARIIGRTLEDLYTTTRRRGGVAKIARLQAELNMWERVVLEPEIDPDLATPATSKSLESMFLRVAHCVATIHVHRPALSFTTADAQFVSSLKACGKASANLVELLFSGLDMMGANVGTSSTIMGDWPESLLVALLYPNGIHMLWQAGLTILFTGWKGYPVTVDQDENIIRSCIETLRRFQRHTDDIGNHIGQCADVLDLLRKKIFSDSQAPPDFEQLQWNVWEWPIASALELANTLDTVPLDLNLEPHRWV